MAVAPFTLQADAAASQALNERMTRGGVVCANLVKAVPGTWWALPRDRQRRYLAFSMLAGLNSVILTPDDDNAPAGFVLNAGDNPVEFGGKLMAPLIECGWWITTIVDADLHVVAIRDV